MMVCEKIDDLDPNTTLVIACQCGQERREAASTFKEARLGFLRLSDVHKVLSCGAYGCDGAMSVTGAVH